MGAPRAELELATVFIPFGCELRKDVANALPLRDAQDLLKLRPLAPKGVQVKLSDGRIARAREGIPVALADWAGDVTVYCGGIARIARWPVVSALKMMGAGSIPDLVVVTYLNANDLDGRLSFGGPQDAADLKTILDHLLERIPRVRALVLRGSCKGALTVLAFLGAYSDSVAAGRVRAAILDSPPLQLERSLSNYMPGLYTLARWFYFRGYKPENRDILDVTRFPPHVALFFAAIDGDAIAPPQDVDRIARHFARLTTAPIWNYTAPRGSARHGRVSTLPGHRERLLAFLISPTVIPIARVGAIGDGCLQVRILALDAEAASSLGPELFTLVLAFLQ